MRELAEKTAAWIAAEVEGAGAAGAVFGLSGGVDSAVVAALCHRALGERALGLLMPCESGLRDAEDAALVAGALGLKTEAVPLDGALCALLEVLPEAPRMARANLKPRLRMAVLYHYANRLGYLVVGCGNRSELMTGYFTKHGDGAADILPIGGLYKTRVRELARALGVPSRIVEKPPGAGLWEGQTDEGELGITYQELDRALAALETGESEGVDPEVLRRVREMVERSGHKRSPARVFERR